MADAPKVDNETALALANWGAGAVAMLIADLRHRRLLDEEFVQHLSDQLQTLEREMPASSSDAIDHVDYILGGEWIGKS